MKKIDRIKAEQIREEIRNAINRIIDEEYESLLREFDVNQDNLSTKNITEIIDELLSSKNDPKEALNDLTPGEESNCM